jgi:hypothetical protein
MRLPERDSATGKGIATAIQAMLGFIVGLILVIWAVPGVPEAVTDYVTNNLAQVLLTVGIPSGLVGFLSNYPRKDVENY